MPLSNLLPVAPSLPLARAIALNLLSACAYLALAVVSVQATAFQAQVSSFWPAAGLALGLCYRYGLVLLPSVWLGTMAVSLWGGTAFAEAALLGCVNMLVPATCVQLLRRLRFRSGFLRIEDVGVFAAASVIGPLVGAFVAATVLVTVGNDDPSTFWRLVAVWWIGDWLGILVATPLVLTFRLRIRLAGGGRVLEAVALGVTVAAVSSFLFLVPLDPFWSVYANSSIAFPLIIWAGMRFGARGVATIWAAVALAALFGTAAGQGPFAGQDVSRSEFGLAVFLALGAIAGLLLAAVNGSRERAMQAERVVISKLGHAERMAAVGTLAAGAAHEINNPLASIGSNLHYLADLLGDREPGAREVIDEMLLGADRIRRIVDDLRFFARDGNATARMPIQLAPSVDVAIRMAEHALRGRADLVTDRAPAPLVQGDPGRLGLVVLNLLVNAAQAIPKDAAERTVTLRTGTAESGQAFVEVRDTGTGITPDVLPRIFEPFFTTRAPGAGTGLGLSTCHEIVAGHGGTIEVESEPGRGSTFRVLLPPANVPVAQPRESSDLSMAANTAAQASSAT